MAQADVARLMAGRRAVKLIHRRAHLDGTGRVWGLNALLATAAVMVFLVRVRTLPTLTKVQSDDGVRQVLSFHLTWWMLAILFFFAEVWVVHLHFKRDAHTFSMSEVALVLGLYFADPWQLVVGQAVGAGAALAFYRRQSPLRLAFNVGQVSLNAGLAAAFFHFLMPGTVGSLGPPAWLAVFASTALPAALSVAEIGTAISLSEGRVQANRFQQALGLTVVHCVTNSALGLIAVTVLVKEPSASILLLVPAATLVIAYRAYISERQKHESIEFLYESSRMLQRSTEVEPALLALLAHVRKMFRAEQGWITLIPGPGEERALRTRVGPESRTEVMQSVDMALLEPLVAKLEAERRAMLVPLELPTSLLAEATEIQDAMIGPLQGESRLMGIIVVANRLGEVSTFDREDLRLFETLAGQASVSLENGRLEQSLSQLRQLEEELKHQAFHDPLTKLANRALFVDRVEHALQRWERKDQPIGVLFIDLDDFKSVNDSLGHSAGDELLIQVSERIKSCLRPADTAARLGGDEFAILLDEAAGEEEVRIVADRIIEALQEPFDLRQHPVSVHASIGVAVHRPDSIRAEELMRNADMAMYSAKTGGKGRWASFEEGMETTLLSRHELKIDLQAALQREEFVVHYQPIVALATGDIRWFEALVRWNHPTRGPIGPTAFIPLAEESGAILELGNRVLRAACHQAARWKRSDPSCANLRISVNISAKQLQNPRLVDEVVSALSDAELDPGSLVLEITENAMIEDTQATLTQFKRLKDLGVLIAIDDFGTGYSSLSWLRKFPVDILKIAKPFVDGLAANPGEMAFLQAISDLGRTLNLEMVAEGIERPVQVEYLRKLNLALGQGFYYAMPMAVTGADGLLQSGPLGTEVVYV